MADAGYRCTCPSREQPCKHTLGLLYLYAGGASFPNSAPPAFVGEWFANRAKRADAKATRESQPASGVQFITLLALSDGELGRFARRNRPLSTQPCAIFRLRHAPQGDTAYSTLPGTSHRNGSENACDRLPR